jgi:cyclopropane-fatty-acyl-phospholipid synthase
LSGPIDWAERGWVPDALVRLGIRGLLAAHLRRLYAPPAEARAALQARLRDSLRAGPVTVHADDANAQHYDVPAEFFRIVLGPRLKYSACAWPQGVTTLAAAEEAMLARTAGRARLADGQSILDLGCGWGSLTLWIAEHFPGARVTALSNSAGQRRHIERTCRERGLGNVRVITADVAAFDTDERFDRVVSVEMLEHVRNHEALFARVARWLSPGGCCFVHVFAHRELAYLYETGGEEAWMARHFFTGGMMPSERWLSGYDRDLVEVERWRENGRDYARTLEAWLSRLDARGAEAREVLARTGESDPARQVRRWRLFLMACAELFAWRGGEEWFVSHALYAPRGAGVAPSAGRASTNWQTSSSPVRKPASQ